MKQPTVRRVRSEVSTCGLVRLLPCLVIAIVPIVPSHAQGTIAFNNLANSDSYPYALSGGLVRFYVRITGDFGQ